MAEVYGYPGDGRARRPEGDRRRLLAGPTLLAGELARVRRRHHRPGVRSAAARGVRRRRLQRRTALVAKPAHRLGAVVVSKRCACQCGRYSYTKFSTVDIPRPPNPERRRDQGPTERSPDASASSSACVAAVAAIAINLSERASAVGPCLSLALAILMAALNMPLGILLGLLGEKVTRPKRLRPPAEVGPVGRGYAQRARNTRLRQVTPPSAFANSDTADRNDAASRARRAGRVVSGNASDTMIDRPITSTSPAHGSVSGT